MTRLYGRALSSERIYEAVPDFRFERTSIVATLNVEGIKAPMVFKGTLNAELFKAYVEQELVKSMKTGDVLILDNLSAHKVKDVLKSLTDKGIQILWLPQYSSDLKPIELAWSKIKAYLRKVKARTYENLILELNRAIELVTNMDAKNWFKHCGYFFEPSLS
jgi:transposase